MVPVVWERLVWTAPQRWVSCQGQVSNLHQTEQSSDLNPGNHALEKEMATHSSVLAWKIPWTEEPSGLQSMWSQRVRHG